MVPVGGIVHGSEVDPRGIAQLPSDRARRDAEPAEEDCEFLSASEVAFLALGLVLGLASGAALIEVIRARPPAPREVRVTVEPNAIPSRIPATLSDPTDAATSPSGAAGGPADPSLRIDPIAAGRSSAPTTAPAAPVAALATPATAATPAAGSSSRLPAGDAPPPFRLAEPRPAATAAPSGTVAWPSPGPWATPATRLGRTVRPTPEPAPAPAANDGQPDLVAVPMSLEPDPLTAALRATAARTATAAMVAAARAEAAGDDEPVGMATAGRETSAGRGTSAIHPSGPNAAPAAGDPAGSRAADGGAPGRTAAGATGRRRGTGAAGGPPPSAPCAEERRIAEERCAVAVRARAGATAAYDAFRSAQRTHDGHVAQAEAAAAAADPRAVRAAKEAAQQQFRLERSRATTREAVEGAARTWLAEINRINHETRDAVSRAERSRATAAALAANLERLALEADAARIPAERAEEACVLAREAVADCDERQERAATAAIAASPIDEIAPPVAAAATPAGGAMAGISPADPTMPDDGTPAPVIVESDPLDAAGSGRDALLVRILRGDREAMQRAVAQLAGAEEDGGRRWQGRLSGLADALIARSIEAVAFEFPDDHFFWGPFSREQNRDIAAGLSSLGFRFDGFGGWVDDRVPTHRDLSLAVGYAGIEPARIRHWPNESELAELYRDVRVAADEYVAGAAGSLTLGELVTLLGRRADGLTDLWNDWGRVRPVLLAA